MRKVGILFVSVGLLAGGCRHAAPDCASFYSLSAKQRETEFRNYDIDRQLRLARCGMDRRPSDTSLSSEIADRGGSIVPVLFDRLESERDELAQTVIIQVFRAMAVKGQLRGRYDVSARLKSDVNRMKIRVYHEIAQDTLAVVEEKVNQ